MRWAAVLVALLVLCSPATGEPETAPAIAQQNGSAITDGWRRAVAIDLRFSRAVPYRVFTLAEPPRLVLDFRGLDWGALDRDALLQSRRIGAVQFGRYLPGWARMVVDLPGPMTVSEAGLATGDDGAHLTVMLHRASQAEFLARSGAPDEPRQDLPPPAAVPANRRAGGAPVVVLDPGHGGLDPGAEAGRLDEKTLMMDFARELRDVLAQAGFEVVLTRDGDYFVSLERRIALAHAAGADVFLSLHADSLSVGQAHGATVHVLSASASDAASAKLAERHDRAEILAGIDLTRVDDAVTDVLLDLARLETGPRSAALARALVDGMTQTGGPMNSRPLRSAAFSVLKAADIPSALIEIGFLSSPRDLRNLSDTGWRARMAAGIRNGLQAWFRSERAD